MEQKSRVYNQNILLGCVIFFLVFFLALSTAVILSVEKEYLAARYPDAVLVSNHSNYTGLPQRFRWDYSLRTSDNFADVYNWYSVTFDLGPEARANENCILLEGSSQKLFLTRYTSVFLCAAPEGQLIFVSRSTAIE